MRSSSRTILFVTVGAFFVQMTMPGMLENAFILVPRLILTRPWSVVTYMLLHAPGIGHILGNMLGLFFFGPRVEERIGTRRFWVLYLVSGITGALLSFFVTPNSPIVGASGGVFGVTLAFAYYWPDAIIHIWGIIPVPARMLVIGYGLYSLFAGYNPRGGGGIAHFAHLGGYLGAFLYLRWLDRKRTAFKRRATAAPPDAVRRVAAYKSIDLTSVHEVNREEIERILDKISAQGLGSLTPKETAFLAMFVPPDAPGPPKT